MLWIPILLIMHIILINVLCVPTFEPDLIMTSQGTTLFGVELFTGCSWFSPQQPGRQGALELVCCSKVAEISVLGDWPRGCLSIQGRMIEVLG